MQVNASIDEADVGRIRPGQHVTFRVDAYPSETFEGVVSQIRLQPVVVQNVTTYGTVIDVPNQQLKLKPGMTATVRVEIAKRTDALRVPNAALRFRPPADLAKSAASVAAGPSSSGAEPAPSASERPRRAASGDRPASGDRSGSGDRGSGGGGKREQIATDVRTVWVLDILDPRPVRVRVGLSDGSLTEVVEGDLKVGDALVTEAIGGDDAPKANTATTPPGGAPPAGGGLRRVF